MRDTSFISLDSILGTIEVPLINILLSYNLLTKITPDVKKLIIYYMIRETNVILSDTSVVIYHNGIDTNRELYTYFTEHINGDKTIILNKLFDKLARSIKKTTNRLIILSPSTPVPSTPESIALLDGEILDELACLQAKPADLRALKKFLNQYSLSDLFKSISKKI